MPTRVNVPPKICEACGTSFERKLKEVPYVFARRRFCSVICSHAPKPFDWVAFDDSSVPEPNTGCLLWTGQLSDKGYGVIWKDGKHRKAHRISYERKYGPIPDDLPLMHRCDTPPCIEPTHLTPGTLSENFKDMWRKGRANVGRGETAGAALLTEDQVRAIHADPRIRDQIAEEYGIAASTVSAIRIGKNWAHLGLGRRDEPDWAKRLNGENVREIRAATGGLRALAERFGVPTQTIADIRRRKSRKDVI